MNKFVVRLVEQSLVAAVLGFGAVATAGSGSLHADVLGAALGAAARAVYGVLVKNLGSDSDQPSVN